jgi:hypothetical protein
MNWTKLLLNFVGYSAFFGLVSGAGLGILYYLVVFQFSISIFIFYTVLLGALVGVLLGGVNGFIFTLITKAFYKKLNLRSYKLVMLFGAITLTAIVGVILFISLFSIYAVTQDSENRIFPISLATILAVLASGYLSQSIIRWHKKSAHLKML